VRSAGGAPGAPAAAAGAAGAATPAPGGLRWAGGTRARRRGGLASPLLPAAGRSGVGGTVLPEPAAPRAPSGRGSRGRHRFRG
jgi:hypothetical protein